MEKSALAQEKVWFDKSIYDQAERLHFEKIAKQSVYAKREPCFKVMSPKILENCSLKPDISLTDYCQNVINSNTVSKKKSGKSKDNKNIENALNETIKTSKSQGKNQKGHKNEDENEVAKKENVDEKKQHNSGKNNGKEKETSPLNEKCSSKEMKEVKNKADTRHRNKGKGKNNADPHKENIPLIKSSEQLSVQGNQQPATPILPAGGSLANEVAKARQHIIQSLQCVDDTAAAAAVCSQNTDAKLDLVGVHNGMTEIMNDLAARVKALEEKFALMMSTIGSAKPAVETAAPAAKQPKEKDDDDDIDLFGSDSEGEDEEAAKVREERLAAYAAKKAKKPVLIAKSSIILDVKPWDDTTDMALMEAEVRKIEMNGLLWGAAKLVPLAFGIHKLQISCVVEDDKVSVDELAEKIQEIEDYVQSVDIAAFNKI